MSSGQQTDPMLVSVFRNTLLYIIVGITLTLAPFADVLGVVHVLEVELCAL